MESYKMTDFNNMEADPNANPRISNYKVGSTVYRIINTSSNSCLSEDYGPSNHYDATPESINKLNQDEREFYFTLDSKLSYDPSQELYTNSVDLPTFITDLITEEIFSSYQELINSNILQMKLEAHDSSDLNSKNEDIKHGKRLSISCKDPEILLSVKSEVIEKIRYQRRKAPWTHFISIPIQNKEVIDKFQEFKTSILKHKYPGITIYHFIKPGKLHFTLLLLKIYSEEELELCYGILDSLTKPLQKIMGESRVDPNSKTISSNLDTEISTSFHTDHDYPAGTSTSEYIRTNSISEKDQKTKKTTNNDGINKRNKKGAYIDKDCKDISYKSNHDSNQNSSVAHEIKSHERTSAKLSLGNKEKSTENSTDPQYQPSNEKKTSNSTTSLEDLYTFSEDPTMARIVYTTFGVTQSTVIDKIVAATEYIIQKFLNERILDSDTLKSQNLYSESRRELGLKLHCTLLNSRYYSQLFSKMNKKNETFDASGLLEDYGNFKFGIFQPVYIDLNTISRGDEEVYDCLKRIQIFKN